MDDALLGPAVPYLLAFTRFLAFFSTGPFFSLPVIPRMTKAALALVCAAALLPAAGTAPALPLHDGQWLLFIAKEVAVGAALGLLASVVLLAAQGAGSLLSMQVGFSFNQYVNPGAFFTGGQLEVFYNVVALLVFFSSGAHLLFFGGLFASLTLFPVWQLTPAAGPEAALTMLGGTLLLAVQLAMPVLGTLLLTEVALAFLARLVPQMNVFFVAAPGKLLLTAALLLVTAPALVGLVGTAYERSAFDLIRYIRALGGG